MRALTRVAAWGAPLLVLGQLLAGPALAETKAAMRLAFPVVVEAPDVVSASSLKNRDVGFRQPVRSAAAVTLTAEQTLQYKPTVLDRKFVKGGLRTVTFPVGAVFVVAVSDVGELYCASGADRTEGWMTFYDVGVCYRDADQDGVFDESLLVEPTFRARAPYEILVQDEPVWKPAQAPYEKLAYDDIPAGEFRLSFTQQKPLIGKPTNIVSLTICWPEALVLPADAEGSRELCGAGSWRPTGQMHDLGGGVRLKAKPGATETVAWGPFEAEVVQGDDGVDVSMTGVYPPGLAMAVLTGAFRNSGDYKFQVSIFDFMRLKTRPTPVAAEPEDGAKP